MTKFARGRFFIALASMIVGVHSLVGCASSQSKLEAFSAIQGNSGFAYAQVNSVYPGINSKSDCDKNFGGDKLRDTREKICGRLEELKVIYISQLKDGKFLTSNEIVPSNLEISSGAIIKLDLAKQPPFRFVEISAFQPNETCKWVGSDNALAYDPITKAGSVVVGFVGGMLLLPAAVHFSSDHQGGVECNGWSYKTAYKEYLGKY